MGSAQKSTSGTGLFRVNMHYHNHRSEPYFSFLKNGQKTIEGRLRKGKYARIQPGDEIEVFNKDETDKINVVVKRVTNYPTIRAMLTAEAFIKILPDVTTVDQGIAVYRKFYPPEDEHQFGVVAIEVEKVVV